MTRKKTKSDALYVRISPEIKRAFNEKAEQFEPLTPSDVLRELVTGFVEDRVTIIPPASKKESLYNVPRIED